MLNGVMVRNFNWELRANVNGEGYELIGRGKRGHGMWIERIHNEAELIQLKIMCKKEKFFFKMA